ncbi:MAG: exo-alpha-sialidase [Promethearchaeota archaeon]|nr:MAG: exo-alpha-sialidase [Candidatus Lokiarchaeota archaeon]
MKNKNELKREFPWFYPIYALFQMIGALALIGCVFTYYLYNHAGIVNLGLILLLIIPYVAILSIYSFYCGFLGLINWIKKKSLKTLKKFKFEEKLSHSPFFVIFHTLLSIALVVSFLFMAVVDYYQSISLYAPVIAFTALTMIGYALLFFLSSLNYGLRILVQKIKKIKPNERPQILPGMVVLSLLALLILPGYFVIYLINDPQLSPGLDRHVDLFIGGEEGYKTYRIPSLLIIPEGSTLNNSETLEEDLVLAICEGRRYSAVDDGEADIVMKRSKDGGETWSDLKVVVDSGDPNDIIRHADPMVVFDNKTGTLFLFYRYIEYENTITLTRKKTLTFLVSSKNGGKDWSDPQEMDLRPPSPGHGVQLKYGSKAGRLVITSYAGAIYSDDHGKTWKEGETTNTGGECEVVESIDGRVYISLRKSKALGQLDKDHRQYAWSEDGGESWGEVEEDPELSTPICMASICRFTDNYTYHKSRILFSNPADYVSRARMTIKMSYDECESWEVEKLLYEGPSGYSDLAVHSNGKISCFFERGRFGYSDVITYTEFDVEWLTEGEDELDSR